MDIQLPPGIDESNWPFRADSRIRLSKYSKPSISKKFLQNKLWSCASLMQHADDCAFVGFDTEGLDGELPTQIGLAYLPGLPTTGPITPLLGSLAWLKFRLEGCQVTCLSIRDSPRGPNYPRTKDGYFANNASVDASEVEMRLVDLLSQWRIKSGKRFLVLVGFHLASNDLYTLLSRWPVALNFLDGWVDTKDLAAEKVEVRNINPNSTPGLQAYINGLGLGDDSPDMERHNAAVDAMMALSLLLIIWKACREGITPHFDFTPRPKFKQRNFNPGNTKRAKREARTAVKQARRQGLIRGHRDLTPELELGDDYEIGSLFGRISGDSDSGISLEGIDANLESPSWHADATQVSATIIFGNRNGTCAMSKNRLSLWEKVRPD